MSDIIHRCEECGAVLPEGNGTNRRYCDACRKIKRIEVNRRYRMNHKGGNCAPLRSCGIAEFAARHSRRGLRRTGSIAFLVARR